MSESEKGKSKINSDEKAEQYLFSIARILNVPPSMFMQAANELESETENSLFEQSELLSIYFGLAPEPRRKLLTYARQLASNQS